MAVNRAALLTGVAVAGMVWRRPVIATVDFVAGPLEQAAEVVGLGDPIREGSNTEFTTIALVGLAGAGLTAIGLSLVGR